MTLWASDWDVLVVEHEMFVYPLRCVIQVPLQIILLASPFVPESFSLNTKEAKIETRNTAKL
jgi:hypothetical protein